jgi:hypothetical protein
VSWSNSHEDRPGRRRAYLVSRRTHPARRQRSDFGDSSGELNAVLSLGVKPPARRRRLDGVSSAELHDDAHKTMMRRARGSLLALASRRRKWPVWRKWRRSGGGGPAVGWRETLGCNLQIGRRRASRALSFHRGCRNPNSIAIACNARVAAELSPRHRPLEAVMTRRRHLGSGRRASLAPPPSTMLPPADRSPQMIDRIRRSPPSAADSGRRERGSAQKCVAPGRPEDWRFR